MFSDPVLDSAAAFLAIFISIVLVGRLLATNRENGRISSDRLRELGSSASASRSGAPGLLDWILSTIPKLGDWRPAGQKAKQEELRSLLLRAGYFSANATQVYRGGKSLLMLLLTGVGIMGGFWLAGGGLKAVVLGSLMGLMLGYLLPGMWLGSQVAKRQQSLLTGFPDVLDMLVLCMEGGASVTAAIQRITDEIQTLHPVLGMEMNIVQREMQLGLSVGDALKKFADRCGLADVRDLAIVIQQSERYGASISKALRNYADTCRSNRQLKAEELAQKAAVKILFPTLLCIFPAIFIVILGPAAFQTAKLFTR
jgi:tight adherence protein C